MSTNHSLPDPRQKVHRGSDKGRAISLVRAAGGRLGLDAAGLAALELDDSLTNVETVLLLGGRLRQTATDELHGLLGLLIRGGTDLHSGQGHRLSYRDAEGVEVRESTRADELNDCECGE